jgi:hypothetical protein
VIDLDLLDEQLEQALTDDVRVLRGAPPARPSSDPPPPTLLPSPPAPDDDPPGFDDWQDDEWAPPAPPAPPSEPAAAPPAPRSEPAATVDRSRRTAARAPQPAGRPARAAAGPRRPGRAHQAAKASRQPAPVRTAATVRSSPDLLAPESEPDELLTAEEVFGARVRSEPAPPARRSAREAPSSRPRSPFAAGVAVGWEKSEAEKKAAAAKRPRRPANRPGLPIHARPEPSQAADAPPTPDPRDAVRERLRQAGAALAAKETPRPAPADDRIEPQHAAQWAALSDQLTPRVEPPPRLSIWRGR